MGTCVHRRGSLRHNARGNTSHWQEENSQGLEVIQSRGRIASGTARRRGNPVEVIWGCWADVDEIHTSDGTIILKDEVEARIGSAGNRCSENSAALMNACAVG